MCLSKSSPKISVILPFYNSEKTIDRAIKSIQNQTYENFECIMINNNSVDSSLRIAGEYQRQDERFLVIHETAKGVVFASNAGEAIARGEYICRMDADDWMFPDRLKLQAEFLDQNKKFGCVSGLVEYVSHRSATEGFERYVDWLNSVKTYDEILCKRFIESPVVNPTAMWRKSISLEHGMYQDGDFPEDYELWLRWLEAGVRITKISKPLIKWYDSDSRLSRTDSRYSEAAFYKIKSKYLAKWLAQNNPHHPQIIVWGASRISRKRAKMMEKYNIEIKGYIDITSKRKLDKNVLLYSDIPKAGDVFILVYIAQLDARNKIQDHLAKRGYSEGKNYLLLS